MKKFYFMNWMILLMGLISSTAFGQTTETLTITRANFPSGSLGYGTDDLWTATTSGGDEITGYFDLYSDANQTTMQTRTKTPIGSYPYNTIEIPGSITGITIINDSGTKTWQPYLSNTTPLTKANYTSAGVSQEEKSVTTSGTSWSFDASDNYKYFYINLTTTGATYLTSITIEYEVAPAVPTITTDLTSLNLDTTVGTTVTSDIEVTGTLLTSDINVAVAGDGFSVSTTTLGDTGGTVTVTYNPTTVGNHSGTITLSNADADDVVVSLNGTATLATPVATAATDVASNSFTANWDAVAGATGYELDVYTSEDGGSVPVNVVGWDFEDENGIADTGVSANSDKIISTNATGLTYSTISGSDGYVATTTGGWNGGSGNKYWQVSLTTVGISNMKLSSTQRSSNTGPKDFKVQYSLNSTDWTDVQGASITVANDFTAGVLSEVALPVECDNQTIVYLRWIMTSNTSVNNGTVAGSGTSAIDNIIIDGDQGGLSNVYHLENENVGNVTSYEVIGLDPETTYYYVVRAVAGAETSANSNEIEVTTTAASTAVTWTGSEWINGTPSIDEDVVVEGPLVVGTDIASLEAKTLTVASNGSVVVKSGNALTVDGAIVNNATAAAFVVENDANLIQVQDVANIGEVTILRNSTPMVRNDMTLWSAPVTGQGVRAFSPETLFNRFWTYDEANYTYKKLFDSDDAADINFATGNGYAIRVKNTLAAGTETVHEGKFIGKLNNGTYTVTVSKTGYGFNLVGNPYASSIDGKAFLDENSDNVNSVHFWTHAHAVGSAEFTNNYLTYNRAGGTDLVLDDLENIASGQGFFVEAASTGTIVFNNEMRTKDEAVFHKNNIERNRIWLSLSSDNKVINNTLLAYMTGATNGIDKQMDAKSITSDITSLYQVINNEAYSIQSRSLPFDQEDKVALGFNAVAAGTYTISIAKTDGLFAEGQAIFLVDKQTNTVHDLATPYTFQATEGVNNDRFVVVYENRTMGTNNFFNQAQVAVYNQNNQVVVEAKNNLSSVEVIDVQGRVVYAKANINGAKHIISTSAKGVLIVKATTQDGQVHTQKVIIK